MPLDIAWSILGPAGWIDLEDRANGYEMHKETHAAQAHSWRRQDISSPYVEGTYTNQAVRENVTEAVAIYVYGDTVFELKTRMDLILAALGQLNYQVKARSGNLLETWDCAIADYTIEMGQEMLNSTMCVIRANIPRRPTVVLEEVIL